MSLTTGCFVRAHGVGKQPPIRQRRPRADTRITVRLLHQMSSSSISFTSVVIVHRLHRVSSSSIAFTQCRHRRHRPSPSQVSSSSISFIQCRHRPSPSLSVVIVHLLHLMSSSSIAFTQCRNRPSPSLNVVNMPIRI